jgi:O-antigen/teichoic acid export membrane protein
MGANVLLARSLEVGEFGAYLLIASVVFVAASVARFGTHQAVVRLITTGLATGNLALARGGLRRCLELVSILAVLVAVLLYLLASPLFTRLGDIPVSSQAIFAAALWTACESVRVVVAEAHRAFGHIGHAAMYGEGPRNFALLAAILAMIWLGGASLEAAVWASALTAVGVLVPSLGVLFVASSRPSHSEGPSWRVLLALAMPLGIASIGATLFQQLDMWIAATALTADELAAYGAAVRLAALLALPVAIANSVLAPRIATLHATGSMRQLERLLRAAASLTAAPPLIAVVASALWGDLALAHLFGEEYSQGAPVLTLLSIAHLLTAVTGLSSLALAMTGHQTKLMAFTLVSTVLMVASAWTLGSNGGVTGIAAGVLVGYGAMNAMTAYSCFTNLGVRSWATVHVGRMVAPRSTRRKTRDR